MYTTARYLVLVTLLACAGCIDDGYRVSFDAATADAMIVSSADAGSLGHDASILDAAAVDASLADANAFETVVDASVVDAAIPPSLALVSASPISGANGVALNATVYLAFSSELDPATVNAASFWLEDAQGQGVTSSITVAGSTATLSPSALLNMSSNYSVHLTMAIASMSGTPLESNVSWSFSTSQDVDTTAPQIVSTSPSADAVNVAFDAALQIIFNESMSAVSISAGVSLVDMHGNLVQVTVTTQGDTVTMVPVDGLNKEEDYTVLVNSSVMDLAGNPLGSNHSWSFTSETRSWGAPELVEHDTTHTVFLGRIGVDAAGNVIAAWEQSDGTRYNLWAARYVVDQGWGAAELIEGFDTGSVHISSLFVDPGGNAIVVWAQDVGGVLHIGANLFDVGNGWGQAQLIDADTGNGQQYPQAAFDSSGGAIAVWEEYVITGSSYSFNLWWNRYEPGTGWGTAAPLEDHNAGSVLGETVVPDGLGGLMAIWTHMSGGGGPDASVWSRRYVPGTGWQTPEIIVPYDPIAPRGYYTPQVAFDASGRGLAVAQVSGGVGVKSFSYDPGTGWSTPVDLWTNDGSFVRAPEFAMNATGQAMVVFVRDPGDGYDVWSRYYEPATGWAAAELVADESADLGFIRHDVGIDEQGNAIAIWARPGNPLGLYSRSFVPGQGWGANELIDTPNTQLPQLVVDRQGDATAFWPKTGTGGYSMWAARRD